MYVCMYVCVDARVYSYTVIFYELWPPYLGQDIASKPVQTMGRTLLFIMAFDPQFMGLLG